MRDSSDSRLESNERIYVLATAGAIEHTLFLNLPLLQYGNVYEFQGVAAFDAFAYWKATNTEFGMLYGI